ncbi:MAG: Selenocysteine-containing peroxiredoxin PrxU [bacterium ADurb.Bin400]|nr:MAG: Selenocysteine-containing peroxiredoxin PrxU [bacterium ADurb.Bin400]
MENDDSILLIGDKFPDYELQTTLGKIRLSESYSGRWWILLAHPGAFTPISTTELIALQNKIVEFKRIGCEIVGLSSDQIFSHIKWKEWIAEKLTVKVEIPLVADEDGKLARRLNMIHSRATLPVRSVVIVDPKGIIRLIMHYPDEIGRSTGELWRAVRALQVATDQEAYMPADWPKNEVIGNSIVLPPATDERSAQRRIKQDRCYDWWFCYRDCKER